MIQRWFEDWDKYSQFFIDHPEQRSGIPDYQVNEKIEGQPKLLKAYPLGEAKRSALKTHLDKLEQQGFIAKAGPELLAASPIHGVPKSPGAFRWVLDLRGVNDSLAHRTPEHALSTRDTLRFMSSFRYFAVLDLEAAFFNVVIHPEFQRYLGISTPFGFYKAIRLPFGLRSATYHFMQWLRLVLAPVRPISDEDGETVADYDVYVDDVCFGADSKGSLADILARALLALALAGVRIQHGKTQAFVDQVELLGHTVRLGVIGIGREHRETFERLLPPNTFRQLRSGLGLFGYFAEMHPSYSAATASLQNLNRSLIRSDAKPSYPVELIPQQTAAWESLIEFFVTHEGIAHPPPSVTVHIDADASLLWVGAVLYFYSEDDGSRRLIQAVSRRLSPSQENWRVFDVNTMTARHQQLLASLPETPGAKKPPAFLRRILASPVPTEPETLLGPALVNLFSPEVINEQALLDEYSLPLIRELQNQRRAQQDLEDPLEFKGWTLDPQDRLRRVGKDGLPAQLYIPLDARSLVMWYTHDILQHTSAELMIPTLSRLVTWPTLTTDVLETIRTCLRCSQIRRSKLDAKQGHFLETELPGRLEAFSVDIAGPFPADRHGHKHLLVVQDVGTRFPWAVPLKDVQAETVVRALHSHVFTLVGYPRAMTSDRGSAFVSRLLAYYTKAHGIELRHIAAYVHQSSIAENFIRWISQRLKLFTAEQWWDWPVRVSSIVFAWRVKPLPDNNPCPFVLLHGRQPRLPTNLALQVEDDPDDAYTAGISAFVDSLKATFEETRAELQRVRNRRRDLANAKRHAATYENGETVLVWINTPTKAVSPYWQPGVIKDKISAVSYTVQLLESLTTREVHVQRLKRMNFQESPIGDLEFEFDYDPNQSIFEDPKLVDFDDILDEDEAKADFSQDEAQAEVQPDLPAEPERQPEQRLRISARRSRRNRKPSPRVLESMESP